MPNVASAMNQGMQRPPWQFGAAVGQSLSLRHCTHASFLQNGDAVGQFESVAQIAQRPPTQNGAAVPQSVLTAHCAHSPAMTLQMGVPPPHCAFVVQPGARQRRSPPQIGVDVGHWAFVVHCTHCPCPT
jgi:hypothetical protein